MKSLMQTVKVSKNKTDYANLLSHILCVITVFIIPLHLCAQDWQLVWEDNFDGPAIDESKWSFATGAGGWGNNELQYYTNRSENAYIENGSLVIMAIEEDYQGSPYSSARMNTRFKGDWLYGRFEIRAKLPQGQGLWPAIWMLPTDWEYGGWAASGEIDIMELIGSNPYTVLGTLHYGGVFPNNTHTGSAYTLNQGASFADEYHTFAIEWDETSIKWFVDDNHYQTQTSWFSTAQEYPAPFNRRFHLLLNIAVGGNLPGYPDQTTLFPQTMHVDYVKVYRDNNEKPTVSIISPSAGEDFTPGSNISISADANDNDGDIEKVLFMQASAILAVDSIPPYEFTAENVAKGAIKSSLKRLIIMAAAALIMLI